MSQLLHGTRDIYDTAAPQIGTISGAAALKARALAAASAALLPALRQVAGDLVGGETLDEAWAVAERLHAEGRAHTLGFWDAPDYAPAEVAEIYLATIARLQASPADSYVSIKPPALRFEPAAARELAAAAGDVRLHADSHGIAVADLTLEFLRTMGETLPAERLSASIPGRWARSPDDAAALLQAGVGVRIVKGQWPDPADPGRDMHSGFLAVVEAAAAHARRPVAVATHDVALAAQALGRLQAAGVPAELEMIHGLASPRLTDVAWAADARVRIYVPYGRGFAPSALRVLCGRPGLAFDLARNLLRRHAA